MAGAICKTCGTEYSFLYDTHDDHDCVAKLCEENARLRSEVERLEEYISDLGRNYDLQEAEVARLEGLILDWYKKADDEPSWNALVAEAKRIRGEK